MIEAIRGGGVDSLVIGPPGQEQVYTLAGSDRTYRLIVEAMNEGAATLAEDGTILYCNSRLARMLDAPLHEVMGGSIALRRSETGLALSACPRCHRPA